VSVEEEEDSGLRENEVLGVVKELIKGTGVGVRDFMGQECVSDVRGEWVKGWSGEPLLVLEYGCRDEGWVSDCPIKEGSQGGQGMGVQGIQVNGAEAGLV